jgi:hypothetical protein
VVFGFFRERSILNPTANPNNSGCVYKSGECGGLSSELSDESGLLGFNQSVIQRFSSRIQVHSFRVMWGHLVEKFDIGKVDVYGF